MTGPETSGWASFAAAIGRLPPERQASRFAQLALEMTSREQRSSAAGEYAARAYDLARRHGSDDMAAVSRALRQFTPGYHVQISTDPDRIGAWDAALKYRVRDDMLVLEIGTGSGILAMLAARAGARVVTCDNDAIIASIARDIVAQNGLSARIDVLHKPVGSLRLGADLPRPADCLILDLFADALFNFEPFKLLREARALLRPDAPVVPMRASLKAALADFGGYARMRPGETGGFDLRALAAVQQNSIALDARDPGLTLRSEPDILLSVDLAGELPDTQGAVERTFASTGGEVNGLVVWIELLLASGITLEPRPGTAPRGFYARPIFYPYAGRLPTAAGQHVTARLAWSGRQTVVTEAG